MPVSKQTQVKFYWTKARKKELLKWEVLGGIFLLAVVIIGANGEYTARQINKAAFIPTVYAQEEPAYVSVEVVEEEEMPSVEAQIREIALESNFEWVDYLVRLARCESGFNPYATNGKNNSPVGSVDRGLFMWNDYWHPEISDECSFSIECSTKATMDIINAGRQHEFVCDLYI